MAEAKKNDPGMSGRHVEIFLKTPLFRFRYMMGKEERELMENAVRISGVVEEERGAGVLVKVEILSNLKETEKELPFDRLFIPYAKIDFIVVE